MRRNTRGIIIILVNILALAGIYFFVYLPTQNIFIAINAKVSFIKYHSTMYIIVGFAILPAYQIGLLIDRYLPKWSKRHVSHWIFYGSIIFTVVFGLMMTAAIKFQLTRNGYTYCKAASYDMNISHFSVYVLDMETCRELAGDTGR